MNDIIRSPSLEDANNNDNSNVEQSEHVHHERIFSATITEYDAQDCGGFHIEAATACYALKGEDKYTFVTSANEPLLGECVARRLMVVDLEL